MQWPREEGKQLSCFSLRSLLCSSSFHSVEQNSCRMCLRGTETLGYQSRATSPIFVKRLTFGIKENIWRSNNQVLAHKMTTLSKENEATFKQICDMSKWHCNIGCWHVNIFWLNSRGMCPFFYGRDYKIKKQATWKKCANFYHAYVKRKICVAICVYICIFFNLAYCLIHLK